MSEEEIKSLEPEALKEYITENTIKIASLKKMKKDQAKAVSDLMKEIDQKTILAMDVLEGKDSTLARKIMFDLQGSFQQK